MDPLEHRVLLSATLVKDLNPQTYGLLPSNMAAFNGADYFLGTSGAPLSNTELYRTDGTAAGTTAVQQISTQSLSVNYSLLAVAGNKLFFTVPQNNGGEQLWQTDGTAQNTIQISSPTVDQFAVLNNVLIIFSGTQILRYDGSGPTPVLIKNFGASGSISTGSFAVTAGGALVFAASDGTTGTELWRTDGSAAGTSLVKDIHPGSGSSSPASFVSMNGVAFFTANDGLNGQELWKSDGTAAGTVLVKNINPTSDGSTPTSLIVAGSNLFFSANDGVDGNQLWVSDGTDAGTTMVTGFQPQATPEKITTIGVVGNELVFTAIANNGVQELFSTMGGSPVVASTYISEFNSASTVVSNGFLYIAFGDYGFAGQLYKTDGTLAGTTALATFSSTADSPRSVAALNSHVLFFADNSINGLELWNTDGTVAGTGQLYNFNPNSGSTAPRNITSVDGNIFFTGFTDLSQSSIALFRSDGTSAGTNQVFSISALDLQNPANFVSFNGLLYFSATDGNAGGWGIWRSDGSAAGTIKVASFTDSLNSPLAPDLTVFGNKLFFVDQTQLWSTNGLPGGASVVVDTGAKYTKPSKLLAVGNLLYFLADTAGTGPMLWVSDGTAANTFMLVNAAGVGGIDNMINDYGTLIFSEGGQLWKTNGTVNGTSQIASFNTVGNDGGNPVVIGSKVYFGATTGSASTSGLWVSDGTSAGTQLVQMDSGPNGLVNANGTLFFQTGSSPSNTTHSATLWTSDGTLQGTTAIKQFGPYPDFSSIRNATPSPVAVGGKVFFIVDDGTALEQFWQSDGTFAGTTLIAGGASPTLLGYVFDIAADNGTAYFGAYDLVHGIELYEIAPTNVPAGVPTNLAATPQSASQVALSWSYTNNDQTGFSVLRSTDPTFATNVVSLTPLSNETLVDSGLLPSTVYYYRVRAFNPAGPASSAATVSVTLPSVLAAPTLLTVTSTSSTTAIVKWTDNSTTETGFNILRSEDPTFATVELTTTVAHGVISFPDSGLLPAHTYYYRVNAYGPGGRSTFATATFTAPPNFIPPPSNLLATSPSPTVVNLTWTDPTLDPTAYTLIIQRQTAGGTLSFLTLGNGGQTSYQDLSARPGTTYTYRIDAISPTLPTSSSNTSTTTTAPSPATQVADVNRIAGPTGYPPSGYTLVGSHIVFTANTGSPGSGTGSTGLWSYDPGAGTTILLRDVNYGLSPYHTSSFIVFDGVGYFSASDNNGAAEIWRTDGTVAGTNVVKNINPGVSYALQSLTLVGNKLFFAGNDGAHGYELWTSDGTAAGTVMVKDIFGGVGGSAPANFTALGSTLFFTATDPAGGTELWKSDGTAGGTARVFDIYPGSGGSNPSRLYVAGNRLFFLAFDPVHGAQLWSTDGTAPGTFAAGAVSASLTSSKFSPQAALGNVLLFVLPDQNGTLWRSDGTAAGTYTIGSDLSSIYRDSQIPTLNGYGYFVATDSNSNLQLWRTEGTLAGTVKVQSLGGPGTMGMQGKVAGNLVYFATYGSNGSQIWAGGGTTPFTLAVTTSTSTTAYLYTLAALNNDLVFVSDDGITGAQLWLSDGTAAGTKLIKTVNPESFPSNPLPYANNPRYPATINGKVYFTANNDPAFGPSPWVTDGTTAGTQRIATGFGFGTENASPDAFLDVNGTVYFVADDGTYGRQLWKTDGTAAGTVLLKNLFPYSLNSYSNIEMLTHVGSTVYFRSDGGANNYQLWKTDGTAAGTLLVANIPDPSTYTDQTTIPPVSLGNLLFFAVRGTLWRSDGTTAGTYSLGSSATVTDYGNSSSFGATLTASGSLVYFSGFAAGAGSFLWKTDGTVANTVQIPDTAPGTTLGSPYDLTDVNGKLYFFAYTNGQYQLWTSGGTSATTLPVESFNLAGARYLTPGSGIVFFAAADSLGLNQLWSTNGTAAGTKLVAEITPPGSVVSANPSNLTFSNNVLYFTAIGSQGYAVYKSDGTAAGTTPIQSYSFPTNGELPIFAAVGNQLLYSDSTGTLWSTTGAVGAQSFVADQLSSTSAAVANGAIFFAAANDATTGFEPWKYSVSPAPMGLAASPVSGTQLNLSWAAIPGATGYELDRSTSASFASFTALSAPGTSLADSGLTPNVQYYYRVRATGLSTAQPYSETEPAVALATPTGLNLTSSSNSQASIAWTDHSNGQAAFEVDRSGDGGVTFSAVAITNVGATVYTDNTLVPGTNYLYRVRAVSGSSGSLCSPTVSVGTSPTVPLAPINLTVTAVQGNEIDLSWTNVANNATGYVLERAANSSFTTITTTSLASNVSSYQDITVAQGQTYYYRVRGINSIGPSTNAGPISQATPLYPLTALAASLTAPNQITLSWTDTSRGAASFQVEWSYDGTFTTPIRTDTVSPGTTTYVASNLKYGTFYYFQVMAFTPSTTSQASTTNAIQTANIPGAVKLAFIQQPGSVMAGSAISPAITVAVEDQSGNVQTGNASTVTLAVNSGPGTLAGTISVAAVNGVATFSNLSLSTAGNYTLIASDATLTSTTSSAFVVSSAASGTLVNGSFENTAVSTYVYDPAGTGWTFSGNAGIEHNGSAWNGPNAPDGVQAAFVQSGGAGGTGQNGSISQSVNFTSAGNFTLQFKAARRSSQTQQIGVYLDGVLAGTYSPTSGASWDTFSAALNITTAGNHTIQFAALNNSGDQSAFIDAMQLTQNVSSPLAVANASFENTAVSTYVYGPTGTGWTFTGNAGIEHNGSAWNAPNAPDGVQAAFVQSAGAGGTGLNGSISQIVNFSAAGSFTLQFKAARRLTQTQQIGLYLDSALIGSYSPTSGSSWDAFSAGLNIATPGNHTIKFAAINNSGDQSAFIDALQLTQAAPVLPTVTNGGFENTAVSTYVYDPTGTGWAFNGNAGIEHNGSAWNGPNAPDGVQAAFLQSGAAGGAGINGSISQSVNFASTGAYTLQFKGAQRYSQGQQIGLYLDGALVNIYTPTSGSSWNTFSASLNIATAGTHTIQFAAMSNSGDQSAFVDSVSFV